MQPGDPLPFPRLKKMIEAFEVIPAFVIVRPGWVRPCQLRVGLPGRAEPVAGRSRRRPGCRHRLGGRQHGQHQSHARPAGKRRARRVIPGRLPRQGAGRADHAATFVRGDPLGPMERPAEHGQDVAPDRRRRPAGRHIRSVMRDAQLRPTGGAHGPMGGHDRQRPRSRAAQFLREAQETVSPCGCRVRELIGATNVDVAYAVQQHNVQLGVESGRRIAGARSV